MEKKRRTEIAELGEFGLIDLLTSGFEPTNDSTLRAAGDDAAVILPPAGEAVLCSTDLLTEGVDFDLTYFPLKHLGYKAVTVAGSDILAMNARPSQLMVSLGVSAKMSVEALQELYEGIAFACREQGIDLVGGDTKASVTGLVLSLTAAGHAPKERIVSRGGAQQNDLICISGNLGAAYMGLRLLEREKRVLADVENPEPKFGGYEYLLEKYLKPRLRRDIVDALAEEGIVPTSMIDLSDGLASDLLQICKASKCGARIYLDRIPIAKQTYALAEELHADPVVAALNGGEDHELLFTVPLAMQEQVMKMGCVDVIGHITPESTGAYLVTPDGSDIRLRARKSNSRGNFPIRLENGPSAGVRAAFFDGVCRDVGQRRCGGRTAARRRCGVFPETVMRKSGRGDENEKAAFVGRL